MPMALDRTIAPAFKPLERINFARAQSTTLANGVPLHVINVGAQPVISIELAYMACAEYEQLGAQSFVAAMFTEGTKSYTSAQLAELLEFYGAHVQVNFQFDRIIVAVHLLKKFLPEVLPIIWEMLSEPSFDEHELEILKARREEGHKINQRKPAFLASCAMRHHIWPHHPYGFTLDIEDIRGQTSEGLHRHFQHYFRGRPFEIIVSGQADDHAINVISQFLGGIDIVQGPTHPIAPLEAQVQQKIIEINKEDAVQDTLRLARHTIGKGHPHEFVLSILNQAYGGYFGSRLMQNLREDKGYTYGIYSQYNVHPQGATVNIGADLAEGSADDALGEIKMEMRRLIEEPLGAEELDLVKNHLLGSFAGSINTPWDLADLFKSVHFFHLDYDYHERYLDSVRHVTAQELQEAAWHYLDPEQFSVVTVRHSPPQS